MDEIGLQEDDRSEVMNGIMHGFLTLARYRELQHYLTFATSPCDNIPGQNWVPAKLGAVWN